MDIYAGKLLKGRYEIIQLISTSDNSVVFKAIDTKKTCTVAVKILKDEYANKHDNGLLYKTELKYKAMKGLYHRCIVDVYKIVFSYDINFIVLEYVDGITLREHILKSKALSVKESVRIIMKVLYTLQYAHKKKVIHSSLNTKNIMITSFGEIKLLNFGIGNTVSNEAFHECVYYNSPEQKRGEVANRQSDIYSVGVILYEMLTGRVPFYGETADSILLKQNIEDYILPRSLVNSIPSSLEDIITHALKNDPSKRYQSLSEMIKDLEVFLKDPSIEFGYKKANIRTENSSSNSQKQENKQTKIKREETVPKSYAEELEIKNEELEQLIVKQKENIEHLYELINNQRNRLDQYDGIVCHLSTQCETLSKTNVNNENEIKRLESENLILKERNKSLKKLIEECLCMEICSFYVLSEDEKLNLAKKYSIISE